MSVLSDGEIKEAFDRGDLGFDPEPDWKTQLQPASVDLRLGRSFRVYKLGMQSEERVLDLREGPPPADYMTKGLIIEGDRPFILKPDEFSLATTVETVSIPAGMVARVDGRSSLGRLGVMIHSTAGFIDPGFRGQITLELSNMGRFPIALYPGMRICQLSFQRLGRPAKRPYSGKYQGQMGATPSQLHLDDDSE